MNEAQAIALDPEGPPPPPMCDAWLDEAALTELFDDLAGCTEIIRVQLKADPRTQVSNVEVSLELARELVRSRQVRGAQIRYRFQHHEWCDTIICMPDRYRLVRCQYP
jgi:hypothetical protein